MRSILFSILLVVIASLAVDRAMATHARGMDLVYTHISGDSFALKLTFYRDCDGINAPGVGGQALPTVNANSDTCSASFSTTLQLISFQEISAVCTALTTTCSGGTYPGIEEYIYTDTIVMPSQCPDWTFSASVCCRNNAITTLAATNVDIYVEATLNNTLSQPNSSPEFSNTPVPFMCFGTTYCFNNGAVDPDGDSLVYSLITPTTGGNAGDTVTYLAGYSATSPLTSTPALSLDSVTGDICISPTAFEVSVMQVRIEEWRNGVMIGRVDRDIQLLVTNCVTPNTLPTVNGINGTGIFTADICAGDSFTFFTNAVDPDTSTQTVTMSWNSGIADATFSISGSPLPTGVFTWVPDSADISTAPHCFTVVVTDDNCPVLGSQILSFCITVSGFIQTNITSTAVSCNGLSDGTATVAVTDGVSPFTYAWNDPGGQTTATASGLAAGTYTVSISDSVGCTPTRTVSVTQPDSLLLTVSETPIVCNGQTNGTTTVAATGGTTPYTYLWNAGAGSQTTATATNLSAGSYTVTVTDANGCTAVGSTTVIEPSVFSVSITSSTNVDCFGQSTGSATAAGSGGLPPYTYAWDAGTGNQTTATASTLPAGTFTITVTDSAGCSVNTNTTISQPVVLSFGSTSSVNVSCNGTSTGSASVTPSGGTTPYTYVWSVSTGSQTTASATGLAAGTHSVTVTDAQGCTIDTDFTLTQPALLVPSLASSTNVSCNGGNDGQAVVSMSGGTTPYTYQWSAGAGSQTTDTAFNLTAGTFTVTITDAQGCDTNLSVTLTEPTLLTSSITDSTNLLCFGDNNGTATVTPAGGTIPYTFLWDANTGNQTDSAATGLTAGTYSVTTTDNQGCTSVSTVNLTQPNQLILSVSGLTNPSCDGENDGDATVVASGGTGVYTYQWPAGAGGSTFQSAFTLTEGSYLVTVTDGVGCTDTQTVVLTAPPPIVGSIFSQTNADCFGASTGSVTVVVSGGTPPYAYEWDPGTGGQTDSTAIGLSAGTYTLTILDDNDCELEIMATITEPTKLTADINDTGLVSCNGGSDGYANVSPKGGTPPYTYLWDVNAGSQTDTTANGLAAGTYTVTVTDNNGCTTTAVAVVGEPAAVSSSMTTTNVSCFGGANGTATSTGSGGTPPYTFLWDANTGGQTNATASNLPIGTYFVTVTDNNGCTGTDSATITQPTAISISVTSQTDVSCALGSDGQATVQGSGGTPPFTYQWNAAAGSQTTATATNLSAGTYQAAVTDSLGCSTTLNVTIGEPTQLVIGITAQTNVSCFGGADGTATVTAVGATPPYTYAWDGGTGSQTTATATGLMAGTYTVTVTDSLGCDTFTSVTITEPTELTLSLSSQTNVSCFSGSDGAATVAASGGTTPYTYQWDAGSGSQTGTTASSLAAGTYTVTVTDSLGCDTNISVTITEPTLLTSSISAQTNVSCTGGSDGTATVTPAGGTAPYQFIWDANAGNQIDSTAQNLVAGTYFVTITDVLGCTTSDSATVTEPTVLTLSQVSVTDVSCAGGSDGTATVTAGGGTPPYTYLWDTAAGSQTTATATGLAAGTYLAAVTDSLGCQEVLTVTVGEPTVLVVAITNQVNVSCFGGADGQATVTATGATPPYTYLWDINAASQTTALATGLAMGTYSVTVTDSLGCDSAVSVTITEPTLLSPTITSSVNVSCFGGSDGQATAQGSGGTPPYTYVWDANAGNQTDTTATGLAAGTYSVTVTDSLNCDSVISVTITEPTLLTTSITAITNVSCNGGSDGSATVTPAGGTPPYQYFWDANAGSQTDSTAQNLLAGTYFVTITDSLGCLTEDSATITEPTILTLSQVSATDASCSGNADGSATVVAAGGTPPYSYLWDTAAGNQASATATGLAAGTYLVVATDSLGCQELLTVAIGQPNPLLVGLLGQANVNCFGDSTGTAVVGVLGGTAPYTYLWDSGANNQTSATATNLPAGTFTLTVTDTLGCDTNLSVTITEPPLLTLGITTITNVSCFTGTDGNATAVAAGGTAPYTYLWDVQAGSQTDTTATGLAAGSYSVTVTDSLGCDTNITATITEPPLLGASITNLGNVSCHGGNNGFATVTATGGTSPYSYQWDAGANNQTDSTAVGLAAGTYSVTVTDTLGCDSTVFVTITEPAQVDISIDSVLNVSCFGGNDGQATVSGIGGTSPYSFLWDAGTGNQTTATATNLSADTFNVLLTDSLGCLTVDTVIITEPTQLVATMTDSVQVSCNGNSDGSATVTPTGGVAPYTYLWDIGTGFQTDSNAQNLTAGTFSVTVSDSNNCSVVESITITEPLILTLSVQSFTNLSCFGGSDGAVTVLPAGGTTPYTATWSSGPDSLSINGLNAGTYTVTVTDTNGCSNQISQVISEPTLLVASVSAITAVSCYNGVDGVATASATGGTGPYTYNWSHGDTLAVADSLSSGFYIVTITDAQGCTDTAQASVTQPAPFLTVVSNLTPVSCNGLSDGSITVGGTGGNLPYSYAWNTGQFTANVSALSAGNYTVTLTDSNGCTADSVINLPEPAVLGLGLAVTNVSCPGGNSGAATANPTGGTAPYTYAWNGGSTSSTISSLFVGTYSVTVTDSNGCAHDSTITITEPLPVVVSVSPDDTICVGDSLPVSASATGGNGIYTFAWDQGLGLGQQHPVSPNSTTVFAVTTVDSLGCVGNPASVEISVRNLFLDTLQALSAGDVCFGDSTTVWATHTGSLPPYNYVWNTLGGGLGPFTVNPLADQTYSVTVTDICGNSLTDSVTVLVNPNPSVNLPALFAQDCAPLTYTFSDTSNTGPVTYLWNFGDGNTSTDPMPTYTYTIPGTYSVTLAITSGAGCTTIGQSGHLVIVDDVPVAGFNADPAVTNLLSPDVTFFNTSLGATSWQWFFGTGDSSTDINPEYTYSDTGRYVVTQIATNAQGCVDTITAPVVVQPTNNILIPNAFTPSTAGPGGGSSYPGGPDNEVFYPLLEYVREYEMMIFNRWGEMLFKTEDLTIGWDGYYRGKLCQQDVYVYKIKVKWLNGQESVEVGDITLLR